MIRLTFEEILPALDGRILRESAVRSVSAVSTDSRTLKPGELFFAIEGETHDGHAFAADALRRGAAAAVVRSDRAAALLSDAPEPGGLIGVADPRAALGRLAAYHRKQVSAEVVAVVGSNGKTTTQSMIDHILRGALRGRASPKSFNNDIGVPLTLLSSEASDDYLVVEIGTNAPGEVAALGAMAQPDLAVITSIGEEHLAGLGDLEGVLAEECSIARSMRAGGFIAVNVELPDVMRHLPTAGLTCTTFGRCPSADLRVTDVQFEEPALTFRLNERFPYRLHMAGRHNAANAAGAAAVALRLGMTHEQIAERLESYVPPPMRGELMELGGARWVNDAYNANPHSALAAIELLESLPADGRRIFVFGEMRELGRRSREFHERIAQRLRSSSLDLIVLVGAAADWMYDTLVTDGLFGRSVERCRDVPACAARLSEVVRPGDVVLLKASRAVGLDRLVESLRSRLQRAPVA